MNRKIVYSVCEAWTLSNIWTFTKILSNIFYSRRIFNAVRIKLNRRQSAVYTKRNCKIKSFQILFQTSAVIIVVWKLFLLHHRQPFASMKHTLILLYHPTPQRQQRENHFLSITKTTQFVSQSVPIFL